MVGPRRDSGSPHRDSGSLHLSGPIILGPGDERPEAWVIDGVMRYVRPRAPVARSLAGWVIPGLVDAHCHLGLVAGGAADRAETLRQAGADIASGVLLARDAGSPADTRWLQGREDVPRLIRAARHVAAVRRYLPGLAVEVEPEDLVRTVRQQARDGDGWVKLVGDWIDRDKGDLAPSFPVGVLKDAVAAAHDEGARVTAHSFAEETIDDLLAAGIDCIEHATGMLPRHYGQLAEAGVPIVPTLVNIATFPEIAARADAKFPVYAAHVRMLAERRRERVAEAFEAGVTIFAGTDAGSVIAHGRIAEDVSELAAAGIPPEAAVGAASWAARTWLGAPGLEEGAPADFVLCSGDPRGDVSVLGRLRHVVLGGRVIR